MSKLIMLGLGLTGWNSLSLEGVDLVKSADKVYLEIYTSPVSTNLKKELEKITGKQVKVVSREFIEDGREIINESKQKKVVVLSSGDPMAATTHMDLRVRAAKEGVETRVIHNASIMTAIFGETGLHAYNFGKTVTMVKSGLTLQTTVTNTIFENLLRRLHTLILLEYDSVSGFFLDPSDAIKSLLATEKELKQNLFHKDTFLIIASRIGGQDQSITCGQISSLDRKEFGKPPHVLIIPGRLHFTEIDALKTLTESLEVDILDNSEKVVRLAETMVRKYVKKSWSALEKARTSSHLNEKMDYTTLFENIECYISDAERFLNQGRDELAILSIGYAEGLLDSLRLLSIDNFSEIWE
jgi:diphthine synthase|tara:strand:- start:1323 stop:2387 length:1065 start_codon:yes stop_codon:yes gene_type:complete